MKSLRKDSETIEQYKVRALSGNCETFNEIQNAVISKAKKENRTDFENLLKEVMKNRIECFYNTFFENIDVLALKADDYFKRNQVVR